MRISTDLIHWKKAGRILENLPPWAGREFPSAKSPWAPCVSYFNGLYHLYYALSVFGSNDSCIALATSTTLDPASSGRLWNDGGIVVRTHPGDPYNAIDPDVVLDKEGRPWLSYGSFHEGIVLRRLNAATGTLDPAHPEVIPLARRPGNDAIEAPNIIRHGEYFYLFVSFDFCCRGAKSTYNIRVGRSKAVTGPYRDRNDKPMMEGGGTLVLETQGRLIGPGHSSIFSGNGKEWLAYHFYDAYWNGTPTLQIRPINWTADGWPEAGAPLSPPPDLGSIPSLPL
jgi:arabinan endo-1,5-alpha-L-arabinosidase